MSTGTGTRGRRNTRRPQDIDLHVGARIRERRIMLGLTQLQLAELIDSPTSRSTSSRRASTALQPARCTSSPRRWASRSAISSTAWRATRSQFDPAQRLLLDLTRSFTAIPDERHRAALCDLTRALTSAERRTAQPTSRRTNSRNSRSSIWALPALVVIAARSAATPTTGAVPARPGGRRPAARAARCGSEVPRSGLRGCPATYSSDALADRLAIATDSLVGDLSGRRRRPLPQGMVRRLVATW